MREFNHSQSFHNNEGNLLHGRLKFFKLNTTELQPIYNSEGTVITNPIFTNTIGQTVQQVFLDDKDYTVQFEQYIGNAEMEEDIDETNWLFQYSCEDIYDTFHIAIDTKGLQVVNNISELRETDPEYIGEHSGNKLIQLAGYYEAGDKPTILYKWDENNTSNDDGGATIKVNDISVGRWVFVENQTDTYDVRHWGAFPANSYTQIKAEQSYAIQNANTYVAGKGSNIYFPASDIGPGYYHLQTSISNAIFDANTYIFIPDNYNINVTMTNNSRNLNIGQTTNYFGRVKVTGSYLHYDLLKTFGSSITKDYSKIQYVPLERFDVDSNIDYPIAANNVDVYITNLPISTSSDNILYLKNCNIHSNGAISSGLYVSFEECYIKENYFSSDNDLENCTFTNCNTLLGDWQSTYLYVTYCHKTNKNIVDLEGRNITRDIWWKNDGDVTFMNVGSTSSEIRFTGAGKKVFQNVIASNLRVSESNNDITFIVKNSDVKVANLNNQRLKDIIVEDSKFEMNRPTTSVIWPESITLFNSTFISTSEIRPSSLDTSKQAFINVVNSEIKCNLNLYQSATSTFNSSIIRNKIDCYSIEIDDCDIYAPINMTNNPSSVTITFAITNNRFRTGSVHNLSATQVSGQKAHLMNAKWLNNVSYVGMFVSLDRTNLHPNELNHTYVYKGNEGSGVLQTGCKINITTTMRNGAAVEGEHNTIYYSTYTGNSSLSGYYGPTALTSTVPPTTDTSKYISGINFFSIGTTGIEFKGTGIARLSNNALAATASPLIATTGYVTSTEWIPYPEAIGGTNYAKDIWFNTGYNWSFRGFRNAPIVTVPYPLANNAPLPITIELERI